MLLAQRLYTGIDRYGFGGLHGLWGILLGFVAWMIVLWGFWSIFGILSAKFSTPETGWLWQIFRVIFVVVICLAFIQLIFNVF